MTLKLLLKCKSIRETKAFYANVLGFTVSDSAEDTCTVEKDGGKIVFTEHDLWKCGESLSGTIYLDAENVDEYYETIKGQVNVQWPIETMSYGSREFGINDCNGYTIAFAGKI